jgi:putative ABC transport system permease protein
MVVIAAIETGQRQSPRFIGWRAEGLGLATLLAVGSLATVYAVGIVIGPSTSSAPGLLTSFEARHVLPILGMVLGNTLTAVTLTLATLVDLVRRERGAIEGQLALGATRNAAFGGVLRQALKTAMMPVINAMAVAGIVTLPGMMTGQILAGADPGDAAKSQIMIMFVISGAAGLGALCAALGGVRLLTDARHRLRLDRLEGSLQ